MFRKKLAELLREKMMSVNSVARMVTASVKEISEDLEHLKKSLKHSGERLVVEPAVCRKCEFVFSDTTYARPSKCPECKGTWIHEPKIGITVD